MQRQPLGRFGAPAETPAAAVNGAAQQSATTLLLVEDNAADARLLREALGSVANDFTLERVERLGEAIVRIADGGVQAVLLDLSLPDSHGLDPLDPLRTAAPN